MSEEKASSTCAEKLSFDTKKQAEATAVVAKYQHGAKLKAYVCRQCGLWHLASDYENGD